MTAATVSLGVPSMSARLMPATNWVGGVISVLTLESALLSVLRVGTDEADKSGSSYTWTAPADTVKYSIAADTVRWLNQQIKLWEDAFRQNEQDKVLSMAPGSDSTNYSFNAGIVYNQATTTTDISEELELTIWISLKGTRGSMRPKEIRSLQPIHRMTFLLKQQPCPRMRM